MPPWKRWIEYSVFNIVMFYNRFENPQFHLIYIKNVNSISYHVETETEENKKILTFQRRYYIQKILNIPINMLPYF